MNLFTFVQNELSWRKAWQKQTKKLTEKQENNRIKARENIDAIGGWLAVSNATWLLTTLVNLQD